MKNHGLGTHNNKMYAKISTGNTISKYPTTYSAHSPKSANYLGYFKIKSSLGVHSQ